MLGYLKADAPGKIVHTLAGGWHDTGDVVSVDEDGFIAIKGRLKRFAKIGGEIVSLAVVESVASALWPDFSHAAVTVPDGRKGEQIVLVTDASRGEPCRASWVGRRITAWPSSPFRDASWSSTTCRCSAPARPT